MPRKHRGSVGRGMLFLPCCRTLDANRRMAACGKAEARAANMYGNYGWLGR